MSNNHHSPTEVELLASEDQRRLQVATSAQRPLNPEPWPDSDRSRCIKMIEGLHGKGAVSAFLQSRQPDLEYKTGAHLLEHEPERLLEALQRRRAELEKQAEIADLLEEIRNAGGIEV